MEFSINEVEKYMKKIYERDFLAINLKYLIENLFIRFEKKFYKDSEMSMWVKKIFHNKFSNELNLGEEVNAINLSWLNSFIKRGDLNNEEFCYFALPIVWAITQIEYSDTNFRRRLYPKIYEKAFIFKNEVFDYLPDEYILNKAKEFKVLSKIDFHEGCIFFEHKNLDIVVMEGLSQAIRIIEDKQRKQNTYFIFQLSWFKTYESFRKELDFVMEITNNRFKAKNFICMANTKEEVLAAIDCGLVYSELINHNCWLDYNKFTSHNKNKRDYDLVCNARPEKWKRVSLGRKIKKLAIIQGNLNRKNDFIDYKELNPIFLNEKRIPWEEVLEILNNSECGGSFSSAEGACYSSSEYLLCGIPIVSTKSKGGRDYFYNDYNSIIVPPDPDEVLKAVETWKQRRINNDYDPNLIRKNHIKESELLRKRFKNIVSRLFYENEINEDVEEIFANFYQHKFIKKSPCLPTPTLT